VRLEHLARQATGASRRHGGVEDHEGDALNEGTFLRGEPWPKPWKATEKPWKTKAKNSDKYGKRLGLAGKMGI